MNINPEIANNFINSAIRDRVSGFDNTDMCTAEVAKDIVRGWKDDGRYVVANAGAYDALGLNHLRGLIQARIIGAAYMLGSADDIGAVYDLASSDQIKLIVSLDTNGAIRHNKSFREETGGSVRPIFDWSTRARMLALQSMPQGLNLVDFITKHGPNSCDVCSAESCLHSDQTYNVASSGADLTIVKSLSKLTEDKHEGSVFHVINEEEGAFIDMVIGGQISTSALVRRIRMNRSE